MEALFKTVEEQLSKAQIGTQIGLRQSSMPKQKGLKRKIARLIERLYLRVAEGTNRDIRSANVEALELLKVYAHMFHLVYDSYERLNAEMTAVKRLFDQLRGSMSEMDAGLNVQIGNMNADMGQIHAKLYEAGKQINDNTLILRLLSNKIEQVGNAAPAHNGEERSAESANRNSAFDSVFYHKFEEAFRGERSEIVSRLRVYLPQLRKQLGDNITDIKCIDIGCGRGEWLDLLKMEGVKNYIGVDINTVQLAICKENGHPVIEQDCIAYLAQQQDDSIDLITGFQIIEHLPGDVFMQLITECHRVLRKGGLALFETPNPSNLVVGAANFYLDPTHQTPMHKLYTKFMLEFGGFNHAEILEVNPGDMSTLKVPHGHDENQQIWQRNFEILNGFFYGPQDYAVIGIK